MLTVSGLALAAIFSSWSFLAYLWQLTLTVRWGGENTWDRLSYFRIALNCSLNSLLRDFAMWTCSGVARCWNVSK